LWFCCCCALAKPEYVLANARFTISVIVKHNKDKILGFLNMFFILGRINNNNVPYKTIAHE